MGRFKVGDEVYYIGNSIKNYKHLIHNKKYKVFGINQTFKQNVIDVTDDFYWYDENLFISEEVYNSLLYQALREDHEN